MNVLVIDDEKQIRRSLRAALESQDYKVSEARSAAEALKMISSSRPDVIVLEPGLPDLDGCELIGRIREKSRTPIVVVSLRSGEADKISALDAGADDYLTKPFKPGEFLARVRAVTRRLVPDGRDAVFVAGRMTMDIHRRHVSVGGRVVHLTPIEYNILKFLVINVDKVVTHKQIIEEIWNKTEDFEGIAHLLRVMISNLRCKLEVDPRKPALILTVPGIGYRLVRGRKNNRQN